MHTKQMTGLEKVNYDMDDRTIDPIKEAELVEQGIKDYEQRKVAPGKQSIQALREKYCK